MPTVIVIPARYGSKNYPGKPLVPIKDISLIQRVYSIASAVERVDGVYVATDDERVASHVESFGGNAIMTPLHLRNATERAMFASQVLTEKLGEEPETILNLQGDAVLTPPWIIQSLVDAMAKDDEIEMATPAVWLPPEQLRSFLNIKADGDVGGTTVTFDRSNNALYFSKRIIPYVRQNWPDPPVYNHIELYGYRFHTLVRLCELQPGPFELAEGLEQLRALENGIPVRVVPVDYRGRTHWTLDAPGDVNTVERLIDREGELVPIFGR